MSLPSLPSGMTYSGVSLRVERGSRAVHISNRGYAWTAVEVEESDRDPWGTPIWRKTTDSLESAILAAVDWLDGAA